MGSKKAISPIIAIIIILLITITIGGAGYSFLSMQWESLTGKGIAVTSTSCTNGNTANVIIRNTGTGDITLSDIRVTNESNRDINPIWTVVGESQVITSLAPGKTGEFNSPCIGRCT